MNEDYNIKSGEKNAILLNGGINNEKIGIQLVSPGSQVFATENNFLFFSGAKSEKTFHVKMQNSESGIILENSDKNKLSLNGTKGTILECHKLQIKTSNPSNFYFNELLTEEYRNGYEQIISGKGITFNFKEDKLNFEINMKEAKGNIFFNNFKNFLLNGDTIYTVTHKIILENKNSKIEIDKNIFLNFDKGEFNLLTQKTKIENSVEFEVKVKENSFHISDSILLKTNQHFKCFSLMGNIEFHNQNGETTLFHNNRPNSSFIFQGNNINSKFNINVHETSINSNRIYFKYQDDFFVNGEGKILFGGNFVDFYLKENEDGDSFKVNGNGNFIFNGKDFINSFQKFNINKNFLISNNNLKIDSNDFLIKSNKTDLKSNDISLNADNISISGKKILFSYGKEQKFLLEDEGIDFRMNGSIFCVKEDELKIISDGKMGITLVSEKGGIRLGGEIDWKCFGNKLLESNLEKKELSIGSKKWDAIIKGQEINFKSKFTQIESQKIESRVGILLENICAETSSISWMIGKNLVLFSPEKLSLIRGELEMELKDDFCILLQNSSFSLSQNQINLQSPNININQNFSINSQKMHISHNSIELNSDKNIILIDEKIDIKGERILLKNGNSGIYLEGNEIVMETGGEEELFNIYLKSDRNFEIKCRNSIEIDVRNYISKISDNYYQIIKGEFNQVFLGNNFIKANLDAYEINGDNLKFGGINWNNKKIKIEGELFNINIDEIIIGNLYGKYVNNNDGIFMGLGKNDEDHFFRLLKNNGIELGTKQNINIVSRGGTTIFSRNKLFLGNDSNNLTILPNNIEIRGLEGIGIIGKQLVLGWSQFGMERGERMVIIGGEKGNIQINEEIGIWENKNIKIKGESIEQYCKNAVNHYENYKLTSDNIWIGGISYSLFCNGDGLEMRGKRIRLEVNEDRVLEIGDELKYNSGDSFWKIGKKGFAINSKDLEWDFKIDIKGEANICPSRNLKMESTIGDIEMKTQSSLVTMDGIGKKIVIKSDGDIIKRAYGKHGIYGGGMEVELDREGKIVTRDSFSIESGGRMLIESESDMMIKQMGTGKLEIVSLGRVEMDVENEMKFRSEKYGELLVDKRGIELVSNLNMEFIGNNTLGRFKLEHAGKGEIKIGKNLDIEINGKLQIFSEDGFILGTKRNVDIMSKEGLKIESNDMMLKFGDARMEGKMLEMEVKIQKWQAMNFLIQQNGFGDLRMESEGKTQIYNKLEGHIARSLEIISEGNSHEDSVYIGSRIGGMVLKGNRIFLDGEVRVERIRPEHHLVVMGNMEVEGMKIGKNLYADEKGLSYLNRETMEMRNMDIKLDGNLIINDLKLDRIESKKKILEIIGEMKIQNRIEVMQGIMLKGGSLGESGGRCRDFLKIELSDDNIWNTGVRIDVKTSDKIAIEINGENAMRTNGRIDVGGIFVRMEEYGELEEVENVEKFVGELNVEKDSKNRLHLVNMEKVDLMETMMKMILLINYQGKKIKELEKKIL